MGDRYPDNYAATKAYAAYSKSMELSDEDNNIDDWEELAEDEQEAWVAAAEAAYKAEHQLLSDQ